MLSRAVAPKGERSMEGTMIWFNPAKRHGFIQTDEGERLRVDEAGLLSGTLLGDRCRGTRVRFDRLSGEPGGARAVDVSLVPLMAARRARLRGRR
jgi:cold shock CspA family protein